MWYCPKALYCRRLHGHVGRLGQADFGYTAEIFERSDRQRFQVLPIRWVVERTFARLNCSRRLFKECELRQQFAETMIHIAFVQLLLRRAL
jgi:transposase